VPLPIAGAIVLGVLDGRRFLFNDMSVPSQWQKASPLTMIDLGERLYMCPPSKDFKDSSSSLLLMLGGK